MNRTLTKVACTNWPYEITWTFDDGTGCLTTETSMDDVTTPAGKSSIAKKAAKLGLGTRAANFSILGGRDACIHGNGVLLERGSAIRPLDRDPEPPAARLRIAPEPA